MNGWRIAATALGAIIAALVLGAIGGALSEWSQQAVLVRDVAIAHEEVKECNQKTDKNTERIACLETDVKTIKMQSAQTQKDIRRIDRNLARLFAKEKVPYEEPKQ